MRQLFEQRLKIYSRLQVVGFGGFYEAIKNSAGFGAAAGIREQVLGVRLREDRGG